MKVFIAILFSAVVVSAIPQGWGPPPPAPVIDLELSGAVALSASGSADAGQAVVENASGNADLVSINGVNAGLAQNGDVVQIAAADLTAPSTSTLQGVSGSNVAAASDYLAAQIIADNSVDVANSAATAVEGEGAVAAAASSENIVITKRN